MQDMEGRRDLAEHLVKDNLISGSTWFRVCVDSKGTAQSNVFHYRYVRGSWLSIARAIWVFVDSFASVSIKKRILCCAPLCGGCEVRDFG